MILRGCTVGGRRPPANPVAQAEAIIRLVGAVLAEQTDEWAEGRRYLGLDILARCRLTTITNTEQETTEPLALTT